MNIGGWTPLVWEGGKNGEYKQVCTLVLFFQNLVMMIFATLQCCAVKSSNREWCNTRHVQNLLEWHTKLLCWFVGMSQRRKWLQEHCTKYKESEVKNVKKSVRGEDAGSSHTDKTVLKCWWSEYHFRAHETYNLHQLNVKREKNKHELLWKQVQPYL